MSIIEVKDKRQWNEFVAKYKHAPFLQSWEWGEFQKQEGNTIFRLGCFNKSNELVSAVLVIKKETPLQNYFYIPRPLVYDFKSDNWKVLLKKIKLLARKEKVFFLRLDPLVSIPGKLQDEDGKSFSVKKTIEVQPQKTIILDLKPDQDDLLKQMHQKTRYNIRLAERKGVKVREGDYNDFKIFWSLMRETEQRDGFRLHDKEHYRNLLSQNNGLFKMYLAEFNETLIAANLVSFFGDTAVYVHGASSSQFRNVMAPYLLQWRAIVDAKNRGFDYYDFYGISVDKWPGVTRFKKGFKGKEVDYPGTFDVIFKLKQYWLYQMLRKIRRVV